MNDFILDSTYKDATIINSNDDIIIVPLGNLPINNLTHHTINLNNTVSNYDTTHNKSSKFNKYNLIDYL